MFLTENENKPAYIHIHTQNNQPINVIAFSPTHLSLYRCAKITFSKT